jgi:soluble lytic murein transglycosylase
VDPLVDVGLGREVTARRRLALVLAAAVGAAVGGWAGWRRAAPPDLSPFDGPVESAAREFGLDPDLLRALIVTESGGDPRARSRAGAVGLLQLMLPSANDVARRLGMGEVRTEDLEDPATNVRLGAGYLAWLLGVFGGEESFAVAAYNAGPEPVKRWRRRAADAPADVVVLREGYEETRRHLLRVRRLRARFARP